MTLEINITNDEDLIINVLRAFESKHSKEKKV